MALGSDYKNIECLRSFPTQVCFFPLSLWYFIKSIQPKEQQRASECSTIDSGVQFSFELETKPRQFCESQEAFG